jgi:hypothetical protein
MTETIHRGPLGALGSLMGSVITQAGALVAPVNPEDGPSFFYQNAGFLDPRFMPNKDGQARGRFPLFMSAASVLTIDAIPSTRALNTIAAAAHIVNGTPMTLVTVCPGGTAVAPFSAQCTAVVPVVPFIANGNFPNQGTAVNCLAIDFGFAIGTTTAGSKNITAVNDVTQFWVGQWIVIGGGGNSAKTLPLITQVLSITPTGTAPAGTLGVSIAPSSTLTASPIGNANLSTLIPAGAAATAANPYWISGAAAILNPAETLARSLIITCNNALGATTTFTVKGYDIYGMPMSEAITVTPASSVTAYGLKAWKYIASITPNATDGTYTFEVGLNDVFGLPLRALKWDQIANSTWAAGALTANTNTFFTVPDMTTPATTTTGDVRGTVQLSAYGPNTGYGTNTSNNSYRLTVMQNIDVSDMMLAGPNASTTLFGVTQT